MDLAPNSLPPWIVAVAQQQETCLKAPKPDYFPKIQAGMFRFRLGHRSYLCQHRGVIELPEVLIEDRRIVLYGANGANGERPATAVAEIGVIKRPLIVLYPGEQKAEMAYQAKTLDADISKFTLGSFNLVNLSPHTVRITHGEEVIELEDAEGRIFTPDVPAGESCC